MAGYPAVNVTTRQNLHRATSVRKRTESSFGGCRLHVPWMYVDSVRFRVHVAFHWCFEVWLPNCFDSVRFFWGDVQLALKLS